MVVESRERWAELMADAGKYYFIAIGGGPESAAAYRAALRHARKDPDREALWVKDAAILPSAELEDLLGGYETVVGATRCRRRHTVQRLEASDLPEKYRSSLIGESFAMADRHDRGGGLFNRPDGR